MIYGSIYIFGTHEMESGIPVPVIEVKVRDSYGNDGYAHLTLDEATQALEDFEKVLHGMKKHGDRLIRSSNINE